MLKFKEYLEEATSKVIGTMGKTKVRMSDLRAMASKGRRGKVNWTNLDLNLRDGNKITIDTETSRALINFYDRQDQRGKEWIEKNIAKSKMHFNVIKKKAYK